MKVLESKIQLGRNAMPTAFPSGDYLAFSCSSAHLSAVSSVSIRNAMSGTKSGWVQKTGGKVASWKTRWMALHDDRHVLAYYKSQVRSLDTTRL